MSESKLIMTLINNDCECVESGECVCDGYNKEFCGCTCGCEDCVTTYTGYADINEEYQCACGGNCACGQFVE